MSLKCDRLVKTIQEIQRLIVPRISQDQEFQAIAQALEQIENSLKLGKLTLQIVSCNLGTAQALHHSLSQYQPYSEAFHISVAPLPNRATPPPPKLTTTLTLLTAAKRQHCYQLSRSRPCMIGRLPESQILIPDHFRLVSGRHANVECAIKSALAPNQMSWRIHDLSRNGTYVNGRSVQGVQKLAKGDRITLGLPYPTEICPEFRFDCQSEENPITTEAATQITDSDVLCLIVDPNQMLTGSEKQLIQKAIQSAIAKRYIIVGMTEPTLSVIQRVQTKITEVKTWLDDLEDGSIFEIIPLLLGSAHPKLEDCIADLNLQPEFENFGKSLGKLIKRKPEDILAKRLAIQVLIQIGKIETLLDFKTKYIEVERQRDEVKLSRVEKSKNKAEIKQAFEQLNQAKIDFFEKAKDNLKSSKMDLLDDYLEDSISCRIHNFLYQLKVAVNKRGSRKFIQLVFPVKTGIKQPSNRRKKAKQVRVEEAFIDANTAVMNFCSQELSLWLDAEWDRLCCSYAQGGLQGLVQKIHQTLSSISSLNLDSSQYSSYQPGQMRDYQAVFGENFTRPPDESLLKEASPVGHILKKIRSQWMQFIFLFSFLSILGIAGGRRQIMRRLTAPIVGAFKTYPEISILILSIALYFLLRSLIRIYYEDRDMEREKAAKKIRENLSSHYQALVKNRLIDRLTPYLNSTLEMEEQRIEATIQDAKQCIEQAVGKFNENQIAVKRRLDEQKKLKTDLENDQKILQKLKNLSYKSL